MLSRPVSCGWKPAPVAIRPGDPAAGEHLAAVGPHDPVDQLEQRALAGAVEAHQADRLALLDGEGHVVEGEEGVADVLAARGGHGHLLEGAVVAQRELLRDVVARRSTSVMAQSRSGILFSSREKTSWRDHQQDQREPPSATKPSSHRLSGMFGRLGRRRVVGGADPEAALDQQHRVGERVPAGRTAASRAEPVLDHGVGVDHRHAEADEVGQDADRRC